MVSMLSWILFSMITICYCTTNQSLKGHEAINAKNKQPYEGNYETYELYDYEYSLEDDTVKEKHRHIKLEAPVRQKHHKEEELHNNSLDTSASSESSDEGSEEESGI